MANGIVKRRLVRANGDGRFGGEAGCRSVFVGAEHALPPGSLAVPFARILATLQATMQKALHAARNWRLATQMALLLSAWDMVTPGVRCQQPEPPPKPTVGEVVRPEDLAKVAKEIEDRAAEAQALLKKGDLEAARRVCRGALQLAELEGASAERLAALDGALRLLGIAALDAGDLQVANTAWETVCSYRQATLPDDDPELQRARQGLGMTRQALGDLRGANALFEKVYAVRSASLPDNHPDLQAARQNLAVSRKELGDLHGALELEEKVLAGLSRILPDDHPDLQTARQNLAVTRKELGDLRGALELAEKVMSVESQTLPDDHPSLQRARSNLASIEFALGDLHGALALDEKVLAVRSATLPDDHPDLQAARGNLAVVKKELGDLRGAQALSEKVIEVFVRSLPDDHPRLQAARFNLAGILFALRDLRGAQALFEKVLADRSATLPDDHPDLQLARHGYANTLVALGDLRGAQVLFEKVLAVCSTTLPADHPTLQAARQSLASTMKEIGDLPGALALEEQILAVRSATLDDDHPDLQTTRLCLASTLRRVGDLAGALALQEKVIAVLSRTLPDDHPDLLLARLHLAVTKAELGDLIGALAVFQGLLAVESKTLPDEHPDLQSLRENIAICDRELGYLPEALELEERVYSVRSEALRDDDPDLQATRLNLAVTRAAIGDLPGALALQEKAVAIFLAALPGDHPLLQTARLNLAGTQRALGDLSAAAQLIRCAMAGGLQRLSRQFVSIRAIPELACQVTRSLSPAASLLDLGSALPPEVAADLRADGLRLLVATRSSEPIAHELLRLVASKHSGATGRLGRELANASRELEDAIALPPAGRTLPDGKKLARDDAIREATLLKDAVEREWLALVPPAQCTAPEVAALAAKLTEHDAAVCFCTYTRRTNDPDKPWVTTDEDRYGAFVLTPTGDVAWLSLSPVSDITDRIATARDLAIDGTRGERVGSGPSLDEVLSSLRERLLDPVRAVLPGGTTRLVVSLTDDMSLLPLELMRRADDPELEIVWSLRELLAERTAPAAKPALLALGSVDYDSAPESAAPPLGETTSSTIATLPAAIATRQGEGGDGGGDRKPKRFPELFNTEAQRVGKMFARAFPDSSATTITAKHASEAAFVAQAPGKTYLHLATHGYFAPESAWKATDAKQGNALSRFDVGQEDRTAQLSPYSLCGIALAGANLPADRLGRREGILTAQEIAQIDLSSCFLATLSACETSLGIRRAGMGLASLRSAFHAAGARFVLATLWEINDTQAEKLMADFYDRLWKQGQDPRTALRAAQQAARDRGAPFRDWAGWVLTGR